MIIDEAQKRFMQNIMDFFWSRVEIDEETGCWNWIGAFSNCGYGKFSIGGLQNRPMTTQGAHRVSYELFVGPIGEGMVVKHRCDNKRCVNPEHLEMGTHQENTQEAYDRNLTNVRKGDVHPFAKITSKDVTDIRKAVANGPYGIQRQIAKQYGISQSTVSMIVNHINWKHVE